MENSKKKALKVSAEPQKNNIISERTGKNAGNAVRNPDNLVKPVADTAKTVSVPAKPSALPENTAANLANLLSALKLPQDNLSRSIIAFARYFSLPLESKFLNSLRQEALNLPGSGAPGREASALGAAAALDKGLKLDKKALAEYAAAIEGSMKSFTGKNPAETPIHSVKQEGRHNDGESGGYDGQDGTEGDGSHQEGGQGKHNYQNNGQKQQENLQKQITSGTLQRQLTEILKDKPLLDMINRIPGKNGRWIVIPFSFFQKGFEFSVSLRILLSDKETFSGKPAVSERLAVDISVKRAADVTKGGTRWFICLERPKSALKGETSAFSPECRVKVFSETIARSTKGKERFKKERLRRELAKALNIPLEQVEIMEKPLLFADSREDILRLVNEEV